MTRPANLGASNYARKGCKVCGAHRHAMQHTVGHREYTHDYLSVRAEAAKESRARAPRLCTSCRNGRHSGRKSEIGCLETIAPEPNDFVCQCAPCREAPSIRRPFASGRSNSERVVIVDLGGVA